MQAVADFMVKRGRVAIRELAERSSSIIDLELKAAAKTAVPGKAMDFDTLVDA
jgi:hypothetical protein